MSKLISLRRVSVVFALLCIVANTLELASGQRDNDDDFDDSGFDDSGYNNQPNRDAEESNQNPSNYSPSSEEDLDDDDVDDADETNMTPQVASKTQEMGPQFGYNQRPQSFYSPANSVMLSNVMPTAGSGDESAQNHYDGLHGRYRRSLDTQKDEVKYVKENQELDIEDLHVPVSLVRRKRYAKHYIGPVYTYVKTDKHAHYKWGVKHKVGKHYGRR